MINNKKLINYIIDKKYLILIKKHISLLGYFQENLDKDKIDHLIKSKNEKKKIDLILHKIFNIVKDEKNKAYKLLLKYKKYWEQLNKDFILYKYIDSNRVYLWFAYVLNELLYINIKKKKKIY